MWEQIEANNAASGQFGLSDVRHLLSEKPGVGESYTSETVVVELGKRSTPSAPPSLLRFHISYENLQDGAIIAPSCNLDTFDFEWEDLVSE